MKKRFVLTTGLSIVLSSQLFGLDFCENKVDTNSLLSKYEELSKDVKANKEELKKLTLDIKCKTFEMKYNRYANKGEKAWRDQKSNAEIYYTINFLNSINDESNLEEVKKEISSFGIGNKSFSTIFGVEIDLKGNKLHYGFFYLDGNEAKFKEVEKVGVSYFKYKDDGIYFDDLEPKYWSDFDKKPEKLVVVKDKKAYSFDTSDFKSLDDVAMLGDEFSVNLFGKENVVSDLNSTKYEVKFTFNGTEDKTEAEKVKILEIKPSLKDVDFKLPAGEYTFEYDGKKEPIRIHYATTINFNIVVPKPEGTNLTKKAEEKNSSDYKNEKDTSPANNSSLLETEYTMTCLGDNSPYPVSFKEIQEHLNPSDAKQCSYELGGKKEGTFENLKSKLDLDQSNESELICKLNKDFKGCKSGNEVKIKKKGK
jgi:hypothetical protein